MVRMEGRGHCSGEREAITAAVEMRGEHRGRKKDYNAVSERAREGGRAKRGNQPNVNSRERAAKDGRAALTRSLLEGQGRALTEDREGRDYAPLRRRNPQPICSSLLFFSEKRRFLGRGVYRAI